MDFRDNSQRWPDAAPTWPGHAGGTLAERLVRVEVSLAHLAPCLDAQHQRLQSHGEATGRLSERIAALEREQTGTLATVARLEDVPARLSAIEHEATARATAKAERRAYRADAVKLALSALPVAIMVLYALGMIGAETFKLLMSSASGLGK